MQFAMPRLGLAQARRILLLQGRLRLVGAVRPSLLGLLLGLVDDGLGVAPGMLDQLLGGAARLLEQGGGLDRKSGV